MFFSSLIFAGREFQSLGATREKAQPPSVFLDLPLGFAKSSPSQRLLQRVLWGLLQYRRQWTCLLYIVARIQYFTLSLIKHFNAMIIFFVLQACCCISTVIYNGEYHWTEYNWNATFNWKFEAKLEDQSQSFHACEERSISQS